MRQASVYNKLSRSKSEISLKTEGIQLTSSKASARSAELMFRACCFMLLLFVRQRDPVFLEPFRVSLIIGASFKPLPTWSCWLNRRVLQWSHQACWRSRSIEYLNILVRDLNSTWVGMLTSYYPPFLSSELYASWAGIPSTYAFPSKYSLENQTQF